MAADFSTLSTDLSTAKTELAALLLKVDAAAVTVAALATTTVGSETDAEKYARLRTLLLAGIGQLNAAASCLAGVCGRHAEQLRVDMVALKGPGGLTLAIDKNWNC